MNGSELPLLNVVAQTENVAKARAGETDLPAASRRAIQRSIAHAASGWGKRPESVQSASGADAVHRKDPEGRQDQSRNKRQRAESPTGSPMLTEPEAQGPASATDLRPHGLLIDLNV